MFIATFHMCLFVFCVSAVDKVTLSAIEKLGATVSNVSQKSSELEVDFHLRGKELSDKDLPKISALKEVVTLHLGGTKITSGGLVHLNTFLSLRRLHLERTKVDDAGLAHLKGLSSLEYLNLYDTAVTDKGLEHLTGFKKLRRLYLWQTKATDAGVSRLQKALPNLVIDTGADLSALPPPEPPKKLGNLKWNPASTFNPPKSRSGPNITVFFENKSKKTIKLFWISYGGDKRLYGEIETGKTRRQNTYTANTWMVCDKEDRPLGYFISEKEDAKAIIPSGI